MNWLLLLLLLYVMYFLILLLCTKGKIISPGTIFTCSFILMFGLALMYEDILDFYITIETFFVCAVSGTVFVAVELLVIEIANRLKIGTVTANDDGRNKRIIHSPIYLKKITLNFILFLNICFLLLTVTSLFLSTDKGSFSSRMNFYKQYQMYGTGIVKFRWIIAQSFKILTALTYVMVYVWIFNFVNFKCKFISNWRYSLSVCCFLISSFVSQGARQPAIELILYCIIIFFVLHLRDKSKSEIFKIIRKVIPILIILAALYYYTMHMAGRNQTSRALLEYVTHNFSGGLHYLNSIINNPSKPEYFGQNSFTGIYQIIVKLGMLPKSAFITVHKNGLYGNTMTIFGRWYEDFGSIGVFIMTGIIALLYSLLFYFKVNRAMIREQHFLRILYAKLSIALVWAGYDDRIRPLLTVGNILVLLLLYFAYVILIKSPYRFVIRR